MSRYSLAMKDDLLEWCGVVEKAERFVNVLREVQNLWLHQEVPLGSMVIQDNHPTVGNNHINACICAGSIWWL